MKNHYTPIRMAKSPNTDNNKCQLGCGAIYSFTAGGNAKPAQPLWRTFWQLLTQLNLLL